MPSHPARSTTTFYPSYTNNFESHESMIHPHPRQTRTNITTRAQHQRIQAARAFAAQQMQHVTEAFLRIREQEAMDPLPWHSPNDKIYRKAMAVRIYHMLVHYSTKLRNVELAGIAFRLEHKLYYSATSLNEYAHPFTLRRRLHRLAFHVAGARVSLQRKDDKKTTFAKPDQIQIRDQEANSVSSIFLMNNNEGVIQNIYSFLPVKDIVTHRRVNRFTAQFLPVCVENLNLELNQAKVFLETMFQYPYLFQKYSRVRALCLYRNPTTVASMNLQSTNLSMFKFVAQTPQWTNLPVYSDAIGEEVVNQLRLVFEQGYFKRIESLLIQGCIVNSPLTNSLPLLIKALLRKQHSKLRELRIAGNCGGDATALTLAQLLISGACPLLRVVDLRNNFIGVKGGLDLSNALRDPKCCALNEICLASNILTDEVVQHLMICLKERTSGCIRFVGLEDNFFSDEMILLMQEKLRLYNIVNVHEALTNANPPVSS